MVRTVATSFAIMAPAAILGIVLLSALDASADVGAAFVLLLCFAAAAVAVAVDLKSAQR
jgi:hypothetical protein